MQSTWSVGYWKEQVLDLGEERLSQLQTSNYSCAELNANEQKQMEFGSCSTFKLGLIVLSAGRLCQTRTHLHCPLTFFWIA